MVLSDLHTPFENSEGTPESLHDWHVDGANYSEQKIREMPTWLKTKKEDYTIDEQYDVVDINSFSEMQKLAYDIVKSPVPFLRNFHWGGKTGKKGRTKNMSRRGLANAQV
jgi:hypothetical protein